MGGALILDGGALILDGGALISFDRCFNKSILFLI